jgi:hypothetical protein
MSMTLETIARGEAAVEDYIEEPDDLPPLMRGGEGLAVNRKMLKMSEPPTLVPGLVRAGGKILLGGPVKTAKSIFAMNLSLNLAWGRPWIGKNFHTSRKVLHIDNEVDSWELKSRFFGLADVEQDGPAEYPPNLHRLSLRDRPDLCDRAKLLEVIRSYDKRHGYDLICVDCLYLLMSDLDENSNSDLSRLSAWFAALGERGAALLVVHHFSKGISHEKSIWDRFRGASSLGAQFDAAVTLATHQKKDHLVCEFASRSFAGDDPMVLKFDPFPRLTLAEGEVVKYRQPGKVAVEDDPVVGSILTDPTISTAALAGVHSITQQAVRDRARKAGLKSVKKKGESNSWVREKDGQLAWLGDES